MIRIVDMTEDYHDEFNFSAFNTITHRFAEEDSNQVWTIKEFINETTFKEEYKDRVISLAHLFKNQLKTNNITLSDKSILCPDCGCIYVDDQRRRFQICPACKYKNHLEDRLKELETKENES